jgi:hypothetical protein
MQPSALITAEQFKTKCGVNDIKLDEEFFMKDFPVEIQLLIAVFGGIALFIVIIAVFAFAILKGVRDKKRAALAFKNIAVQMGWDFSETVFPSIKPFINYIERVHPESYRFNSGMSSPTHNILSGASNVVQFAYFHFNYSRSNAAITDAGYHKRSYESGVMLVTNNLRLPEFAVNQTGTLQDIANFFSGSNGQTPFQEKYNLIENQMLLQRYFNREVCQIFANNEILYAFGNANMLCLFFRRSSNSLPSLANIQFQLNLTWQIANLLAAK